MGREEEKRRKRSRDRLRLTGEDERTGGLIGCKDLVRENQFSRARSQETSRDERTWSTSSVLPRIVSTMNRPSGSSRNPSLLGEHSSRAMLLGMGRRSWLKDTRQYAHASDCDRNIDSWPTSVSRR